MPAPNYCVQPIPFKYIAAFSACIIFVLIFCVGSTYMLITGLFEKEPGFFVSFFIFAALSCFCVFAAKQLYSSEIHKYLHTWDLIPVNQLGTANIKYDSKLSAYKQSPKNIYIVSRCSSCGEARYQRYKLK